MIILFLLTELFLAKELSALLETVKSNQFSMQILTQMKFLMAEKKTPYEILVYINDMEDELVQDIIKDMNEYHTQQLINSQKKQELKYQMMLTKFTSNLQGDELQLLSNEAKLSEDIRMQRMDLIQEFGQIIPNLEAIHQEQQQDFDIENSELVMFSDNFKEVSSNTQKLNGQKQHIKENPEAILKEFISNAGDGSQFSLLFSQIEQSQNSGSLGEAIQKSKQLVADCQQKLLAAMKYQTELYDNVRSSLMQDNDQWKMDMASIEPIAKVTKEKLGQLQKQKDDLQMALKQEQSKYNELQLDIDNFYTSYSSKRLQDMNNLNLVRMIKQFYSEHLDVLEDFIKNKIPQQTR